MRHARSVTSGRLVAVLLASTLFASSLARVDRAAAAEPAAVADSLLGQFGEILKM